MCLIFLEGLQAREMWREIEVFAQRNKICQRIHKPHVIDKTVRVPNAFNAKLFFAPLHTVVMEFDVFGRGRMVI
jgi:hypothetical protein